MFFIAGGSGKDQACQKSVKIYPSHNLNLNVIICLFFINEFPELTLIFIFLKPLSMKIVNMGENISKSGRNSWVRKKHFQKTDKWPGEMNEISGKFRK